MLLTEYDEAFHIASEKDISFKQGQESERMNTELERQRADAAQLQATTEKQRADAAQLQATTERQRADAAQLQATILSYKLQGKNDEDAALLTGLTVEEVKAVIAAALKT